MEKEDYISIKRSPQPPHQMDVCIPGMSPQGMAGAPNDQHICAVCRDRASGRHYGVQSCEGCKAFFKRTVRKDLSYACRDDKKCVINKQHRYRCQYCRYNKCLQMGMKREAVQEQRQGNRKQGRKGEVESTSSVQNDMPTDRILQAEMTTDQPPREEDVVYSQGDPVHNIMTAANKQLFCLVNWAKLIPHFTDLPGEDQVMLLKAGWNELLIAGCSHRSVGVTDGLLLATGVLIKHSSASTAGIGPIFDRILFELVRKMREMKMDKTELGCLRAIVLYNPDVKNLKAVSEVEALKEKVHTSMKDYCKIHYPQEPDRCGKLLLRLPALRYIGLKCMEHLIFFKMMGDIPIGTLLMEMMENGNRTGT